MQSCLIYLTGVVALGLAAQWLAWRLRLPAILLLLGFGFLFGLIGGEARASRLVRETAALIEREGFTVLLVDTNQQAIATARMAGLPTCWANICSEYAREEIDVGGLGRFMAITPNDEVNSLAAREFIELFDRAEVYQLPAKDVQLERGQRLMPQQVGRILFDPDATFDRLSGRLASGAVLKKTRLSEEFDYTAFANLYGESAVVMFVIDETGQLTVRTGDSTADPRPGQTLISLVDAIDESGEQYR